MRAHLLCTWCIAGPGALPRDHLLDRVAEKQVRIVVDQAHDGRPDDALDLAADGRSRCAGDELSIDEVRGQPRVGCALESDQLSS